MATVPLSVKAIRYARAYYERSFELAPADALTVTGQTTELLLTLAYAWVGLGYSGIGYLALLAVAFAIYAVYLYRHIERQKEVFLGLKEAVGWVIGDFTSHQSLDIWIPEPVRNRLCHLTFPEGTFDGRSGQTVAQQHPGGVSAG